MHDELEILVIGGGAAGLSAALVLGRARRRVLVVDAGEQSNRAAAHVGGLLGHDGTPPGRLYERARAQLAPYDSVTVRDDVVVDARVADDAFAAILGTGGAVTAHRVLLAAGMRYAVPDLPGAAALWGGPVFHCPFCHGWEVRDRPLAVLGGGEEGVMRALLLLGWTDDVVLLTDGASGLDAEQRAALGAAGVPVEERRVVRLLDGPAPGAGDRRLTGIELEDGEVLTREGLLVGAPPRQRSGLAEGLGAALTDAGLVAVDARGATSVPGLFAAGDVCTPMPTVARAVAGGSTAAAAIVQDLVAARRAAVVATG